MKLWLLQSVYRRAVEPVPHFPYGYLRAVVVGFDVLPGDVGYVFLVAVAFPVEYQAALVLLPALSELGCSEEQAKFQGHVEPR